VNLTTRMMSRRFFAALRMTIQGAVILSAAKNLTSTYGSSPYNPELVNALFLVELGSQACGGVVESTRSAHALRAKHTSTISVASTITTVGTRIST